MGVDRFCPLNLYIPQSTKFNVTYVYLRTKIEKLDENLLSNKTNLYVKNNLGKY